MKSALLLFNVIFSQSINNLFAQQKPSNEELTEICNKVEQVIGEDWFVHQTNNGFEVYFCRSCNENYQKWVKNNDFSLGTENHATHFTQKDRYNFFKPELADSMSYFGTVSQLVHPFIDSAQLRNFKAEYPNNGIMKFVFKIDRKWTEKKVSDAAANNELLKTEILSTPLYKTSMDIFSDYRFWLPESYLRQRTEKGYDFYFERLPYSSCWYDYSIFIEQDKPWFYCEPAYVDPSEENYPGNPRIFIEDERCRTLKIIALTLGINDFTLIN